MKIFHSVKYLERGPELPIKPISVGMVRDDGEELYVINMDMQLSVVVNSLQIQLNVLPYLPIRVTGQASSIMNSVIEWDGEHEDIHRVVAADQMASLVKNFILDYDQEEYGKPELWSYYGAVDYVVLCQLFGAMADLPPGLPLYTNDLVQEWNRLGQPATLPASPTEHRAIDDARWNQLAYDELEKWEWSDPGGVRDSADSGTGDVNE